jgi:hypothetical protein
MNLLSAALLTSLLMATAAPYPLDDTSREVPTKGKLRCDRDALVKYAGGSLRYHKKVTVHPAFKARLVRFEAVVQAVAIDVYGRAPKTIKHLGTYNCRRIRSMPHLMSEHALGNAIDVAGFDFGPLPKGSEGPAGLSKRHRRAFKVRMKAHWEAKGRDARHARFLRTLARRLTQAGIFRVLLGPAWPGHDDHFHFDMAPYTLVKIFED